MLHRVWGPGLLGLLSHPASALSMLAKLLIVVEPRGLLALRLQVVASGCRVRLRNRGVGLPREAALPHCVAIQSLSLEPRE